MKPSTPLVIHGWVLFAHPIFLDQIDTLIAQIEALKLKDPTGYKSKNATKRLAAIEKLIFDIIPQNPTNSEFMLGGALGAGAHWFRAKFFKQYRLFFRYHHAARIIVYGWVNDDATKRAYERADDAYRVFRAMLGKGHPPDDWESLKREAELHASRFSQIADIKP